MGELIDLNAQIPDSRIPGGIARDTETTAAIDAHLATADPHPIYLTPVEGDARYLQFKRDVFTFTSGLTQGALTGLAHGLDATRIRSISSFIFVNLSISAGFAPRILPGGIAGLIGYHYSITVDANSILCRLHPTDSARILNCPVSVLIEWV